MSPPQKHVVSFGCVAATVVGLSVQIEGALFVVAGVLMLVV